MEPRLLPGLAVGFLRSSHKKPVITCAKSRTIAYTGDTDLAILPNRNTFEPNAAAVAFHEASTSNCAVLPFLVLPLFCSVHIRNVAAKKRDASTALLRRLHAHMTQHEVDFIGGDFNMSAFSIVGGVFADPKCSAPGNSLLWGLGVLEDSNRKRHMNGVWIHTAAPNSKRGPCTWTPCHHGPLSCFSTSTHHQLPGA